MGLYQNMLAEPVSELELREPAIAQPDETVRDAVEHMRTKKLGCVIVTDENRKPVGMFTEGMVTRLLSDDPAAMGRPIREQMANHFPWVKLTDPIVDVLTAMQTKNVRFLCVVDDDGQLAAITGQKGLMEYVADHFPTVMVQRVGSPVPQEREGA